MELAWFDVLAFVVFIAAVIGISLYASRKQESSEDYFLAGRALTWYLIGFSLIASNISTEHFVGMAGQGFDMGLAVASYEWIAAVTLVLVALWLLPKFLRSGIYTIPEFLEHRFSAGARAIMAAYMLLAYVAVALAAVLYSGALALETIFDIPGIIERAFWAELAKTDPAAASEAAHTWALIGSVWLIGLLAGAYTIYGGLKAVVWSDLLQGAALLLGGILVTILGFRALGGGELFAGVERFFENSGGKLHTILPASHEVMPWTIFLGGIWIPNIFYWGLNQFITQRTLGAKSLAEGQRGILMAAGLKLLIPFIIVFPGIMAFELYADKIEMADKAYPYMIREILPVGLTGIMFAALFGAVMSTLDSMLNSAATIFTIDLYKRHIRPQSEPAKLVRMGRMVTGVIVLISCLWAPNLAKFPAGVFDFIQRFWGFFSPGIVAVFIFGLIIKKAPPLAAAGALLLNPVVYGLLLLLAPDMSFLNSMVVSLLACWAFMAAATLIKPLPEPRVLPTITDIELTATPGAKIWGAATVLVTVALYLLFR